MEAETVSSIRDLALSAGLIAFNNGDDIRNVSVSVKPSLFPAECFELAARLQPHFNRVLDEMSRDSATMTEIFSRIGKHDRFVESLYQIFLEVQRKGNVQTTHVGIHRSDYLIDKSMKTNEIQLKQVEINTISCALVAQSTSVVDFHRYIIDHYFEDDTTLKQGQLRENASLIKVIDAMALAHREYGKPSAYILFVVETKEWFRFDQRLVEFNLWKKHGIRAIRRTMVEIFEQAQLNDHRELLIGSKEISFIYYRTGSGPNHYPTNKEWEARKRMELSRASSCPSIAYQLVGMKKVQQVLSKEGILERYCNDAEVVREMRSTFVRQYSLEKGEKGDEIIKMVLEHPEQYVLKPQREGGGNNIFDEAIKAVLCNLDSTERESYIAMEYINSPSLTNIVLKNSELEGVVVNKLISELGIFGVFIRKGNDTLLNDEAGFLLRSKQEHVKQDKVEFGAAIDSPLLVSNQVYLQNIQ